MGLRPLHCHFCRRSYPMPWGSIDTNTWLEFKFFQLQSKRAYFGMVQILLELCKSAILRIGALGWDAGEWKVAKRPSTLNWQEHFLHLKYQRNDAAEYEQDCMKKCIACCLFWRTVREIEMEQGSFHLYCDDLLPSNVLVSEDLMATEVIN